MGHASCSLVHDILPGFFSDGVENMLNLQDLSERVINKHVSDEHWVSVLLSSSKIFQPHALVQEVSAPKFLQDTYKVVISLNQTCSPDLFSFEHVTTNRCLCIWMVNLGVRLLALPYGMTQLLS